MFIMIRPMTTAMAMLEKNSRNVRPAKGAKAIQSAQLGNARRQRCEYQWDDDKKQQSQEYLAEGIEQAARQCACASEDDRMEVADTQCDHACDDADGQAPKNACCQRSRIAHASNVRSRGSDVMSAHAHITAMR